MTAGRIEAYVHSDSITENKGAALVKVTADTDFAARTDAFKAFAHDVAMYTFGALGHTRMVAAGHDMWNWVILKFPDMEDRRRALERELGESIKVTEFTILRM